jgi:hypothetical protein
MDFLQEIVPQSEVGDNCRVIPSQYSGGFDPEWFFTNLSDLAASRMYTPTSCSSSELEREREYKSTARFDGQIMWLQIPGSDKELQDTASSKLRADWSSAAATNISSPLNKDCRIGR